MDWEPIETVPEGVYVPRIGKWIRLEDLGAVIDAALAAGGE